MLQCSKAMTIDIYLMSSYDLYFNHHFTLIVHFISVQFISVVQRAGTQVRKALARERRAQHVHLL